MKEILGSAGCVVLTLIAVIVLSVGGWFAWVATAEIRGRGEAHVQIHSAASLLGRRQQFFDLCVSVQTREAAIDAEQARLDQTTIPAIRNQIMENISGNQTARAKSINEYNAAALNDYTDGQFLAANLPYQLDTTAYVPGSEHTHCAS